VDFYTIEAIGYGMACVVGALCILAEQLIGLTSEFFAKPVNFNDQMDHSIKGVVSL
jgi:hypothetical protein